jgi:hypothetical protein
MGEIRNPSKEQVRDWFTARRERRLPIPDMEDVRLQLGWRLAAVEMSIEEPLEQIGQCSPPNLE